MGKISTHELLDRYFESVSDTTIPLSRRQIDRPELYAYEIKVGKELIDMDVEDLFGLFLELKNKRDGHEIEFMTSHSSYGQLASLLRAIFNYYIDNVEPIRNPLNDKRMKGVAAFKHLSQGKENLRWEIVQDVIDDLHGDRDSENADYVELILKLFYEGFANAEEIVSLKREMVDPKTMAARMSGKTIHLSQRSYSLLEHFYFADEIPGFRGDYSLVSWRGSYFKFIVRPNNALDIDSRSSRAMCDIINRCIAVQVNKRYKTKINYSNLYYLGFYDFIVKRYGKERVNQMLTSFRNAEDIDTLIRSAREYGVDVDNVSRLKYYMSPFIEAR